MFLITRDIFCSQKGQQTDIPPWPHTHHVDKSVVYLQIELLDMFWHISFIYTWVLTTAVIVQGRAREGTILF